MTARPRAPSADASQEFSSTWKYIPCGASRRLGAKWLLHRVVRSLLWVYLRLLHGFQVRYDPGMPRGRAYIAIISHTSALDVPALMVADPYDPPTSMIIKHEAARIPVLSIILRLWGVISVERRGRDVRALRQILRTFQEGRGICVAPQGTRSRDARLGPFNPVLVRFILESNVAVFPVAIVGTFESLPRGARLPRPHKVYIDTGPTLDLERFRGRRLLDEELHEPARLMRDALASILPEHMKPDPAAPLLGTYSPED